jgi:hypothetical protein
VEAAADALAAAWDDEHHTEIASMWGESEDLGFLGGVLDMVGSSARSASPSPSS